MSHVISIVSVASLLLTVVFAYLSWRESRYARQELAAAFSAEKAPQLKVVSAHVFAGNYFAEFQNTGESVALTVSATLTRDAMFPAASRTPDPKPSAAHPVASIRRGQAVTVPIEPSAALAAALGSRIGALVQIGATEVVKARPERFVVLTVTYEDTFRTKYQDEVHLLAPAE